MELLDVSQILAEALPQLSPEDLRDEDGADAHVSFPFRDAYQVSLGYNRQIEAWMLCVDADTRQLSDADRARLHAALVQATNEARFASASVGSIGAHGRLQVATPLVERPDAQTIAGVLSLHIDLLVPETVDDAMEAGADSVLFRL